MADLVAALAPLGLDLRNYRVAGLGPLEPRAVLWHHTGSAAGSGDLPSLGIVLNGRPWAGPNGETYLPGPLANVLIGRAGTVAVITDGKANHAGAGAWPGLSGSQVMIGVEVENDGIGEAWTPGLLAICARVAVQLGKVFGIPPTSQIGHKEWAQPPGRKTDPSFDMGAFRVAIEALQGDDDMTPQQFADAIGAKFDAGVVKVPLINDDGQTFTDYPLAAALTYTHQELKLARLRAG